MISFWRQLRLLLWKAYKIKRRQKLWIAIEIIIPVLLFALLVIIRTRDFFILSNECHYDAKSFPSAGVLPFMQSLFCSISNDCKDHPTTADETFLVNLKPEKKTLLVDIVRWFRSFLEIISENPNRWSTIFLQMSDIVHIVATLRNNGTMQDEGLNLTYPFSTFFASSDDMVSTLHHDFGYDNVTAEEFRYISVTPQFIFYALQEISNMSLHEFSAVGALNHAEIPFLCNKSKTTRLFTSVNDVHKEIDFCRFTYSNVILSFLFSNEQYDLPKIASHLAAQTLHYMKAKSGNGQKSFSLSDLTLDLRFAIEEMRRFPYLNFTSLTDIRAFEDAVFCGGIREMMNHDTGNKPISFLNPKLEDLKKRITQFISEINPELSENEKGMCGNISTDEAFECKSIPFGMPQFKTLLRGYILVAPDSPVVSKIVDKLNEPLKMLNTLRNFVNDLSDISTPIQDALFDSDLRVASEVLLEFFPDLDQNSTLRFALEHWFANSTDPRSLFVSVKEIAGQLGNLVKCFRLDRFVIVKNEEELEQRSACLITHDQYLSGVVFQNLTANSTELPDLIRYKIRHAPTLIDGTRDVMDTRNLLSRDDPWMDLKYLSFGFSFLQEAVERAIVLQMTNFSIETGVQAQQEPYPCVVSDTFKVSNFLALFVILSWMTSSSLLVKNIVWEKEARLKEIMRIMGLGNTIHWLAWATQALTFNAFSVMVISVLLKYGNILGRTDFTILLTLLWLFAMACACQSIFLSTLFDRANVATVATSLIFFVCFFPCQLMIYSGTPTLNSISLLLPQTAVGFGMNLLGYADDIGNATWADLDQIASEDLGISLSKVFIGLSLDCFIYTVLAWYISAVFPGMYGIPKPWFFFLDLPYKVLKSSPLRRLWMSKVAETIASLENGSPAQLLTNGCIEPQVTGSSFEPVHSELREAVKICNLTKIYGNNTKAVDSLSTTFYESQITAFLGHNGAGKTTTMSILTGLYPPTHGTIMVYGLDIRMDIRRIRDFMGFCPQHNILFDGMTVEEQLQFYATLKGVSSKRLHIEVEAIIRDVGLEKKRYWTANTLSGGMKRKLCIGIALIGGSKLIILDEPTAGIDAYARRSIWQLLLKHKQDRTMILSTHHMDEADVLADRITIISEGRLKAAGSSLFLKRKFGNGYQLTVAKSLPPAFTTKNECLAIADSQGATLTAYIEQFCGREGVELVEEVEFESVYKLSLELKADQLAALFEGLESAKELLGVTSYGLSAPSLQQIFLNIAPVHDLKLKKDTSSNGLLSNWLLSSFRRCRRNHTVSHHISDTLKANTDLGPKVMENGEDEKMGTANCKTLDTLPEYPAARFVTSASQLHFLHAKALLYKRLNISGRSWISLFAELILPLCLLVSAELYIKIQRPPPPLSRTQPALPLVPLIYQNRTNFYFALWERGLPNRTKGREYLEAMTNPPGIGTRCVERSLDPFFNSSRSHCEFGTGKLNLTRDSSITYNEPQSCGCLPKIGWNCTYNDYPHSKLRSVHLNSTDVLWDLSYRNISQYRLITKGNSTLWPAYPETLILGGWTFGHENAQSKDEREIELSASGMDDVLTIIRNASEIIKLDWASVIEQWNRSRDDDPFTLANLSTSEMFKKILSHLDTKHITKIWFNNKLWASLPINTNAYHNAVLRSLLNESRRPKVGIFAINHPVNETITQGLGGREKAMSFRVVLIMLVLSVIPSSFAMFMVDERISFSKHLQRIFGVSPWLYLIANLLYDFAFYFACSLLVIVIYWIMGINLFSYSLEAVYASVLLMFLYGLSCILLVNILATWFSSPTLAFALISCGMFFVGVVTTFVVMILELLMHGDEGLKSAYEVCSKVFLILPQYNLGMGIYRMGLFGAVVDQASKILKINGRSDMIPLIPVPYVLDWDVVGEHCAALFILIVLYLAALLLVEYRSRFKFLRQRERRRTKALLKAESGKASEKHRLIDADVVKEQELVDKLQDVDEYGLVVKHLSKAYGKSHLAVNNLSFAVGKGHCFGLLGVNGAGKTTTFSMLTGVNSTCEGEVFVNGNSILTDGDQCFRFLGYCPQIDALSAKCTAREHLAFYSRVRGICEEDIDAVVQWALEHMQLKPYADEVSASYSGGNKRKLSAAIALVADPPVVLLDEPSAGMDPSTQQFMWNLILRLRRSRRTVIITSHSMEECEFLCTRIAIMVAGQFECIGSIQHLKERFGEGYTLTLKVSLIEQVEEAQHLIETGLPGAELRSIHCTTLFYKLQQQSDMALANAFKVINRMENFVKIEDYSLSQTTLDDVFVSFASNSTSSHEKKTAATSDDDQNVPLDKI